MRAGLVSRRALSAAIIGLCLQSGTVAAQDTAPRTELWNGLYADMSAADAAAALRSLKIKHSETVQQGVAIVTIKRQQTIAGMNVDVALGFSRKGLQQVQFFAVGPNQPDYDSVIDRLTRLYGAPIGQHFDPLVRGFGGNSIYAEAFFGAPPRSITVFYRLYCTPYARRVPADQEIELRIEARPGPFPLPRNNVSEPRLASCADLKASEPVDRPRRPPA